MPDANDGSNLHRHCGLKWGRPQIIVGSVLIAISLLLFIAGVILALVRFPTAKTAEGWAWASPSAHSPTIVTRPPLSLVDEDNNSGDSSRSGTLIRATVYVQPYSSGDSAAELSFINNTLVESARAVDSSFVAAGVGCGPSDGSPIEIRLDGLAASTHFEYRIFFSKVGTGEPCVLGSGGGESSETVSGSFTTVAEPGVPANLAFATSSCARTGSDNVVFEKIADKLNSFAEWKKTSTFFFTSGDLAYADIEVNDTRAYGLDIYEAAQSSARQRSLYSRHAWIYMWDDHDFGPNDSDGTFVGRTAARVAYQTYAPHAALPLASTTVESPALNGTPIEGRQAFELGSSAGIAPGQAVPPEDIAIFQRFDAGRVRLLALDLRSESSPASGDPASNTYLGATQLAWLKHQLKEAAESYAADKLTVLFVSSSTPWIIKDGAKYGWGPYSAERKEIGLYVDSLNSNLTAAGLSRLPMIMLCGDAHMAAFDDGTNNQWGGFPVVHAAALDQHTSVKGGPFSHGCWAGIHQWALLEVLDPLDPASSNINSANNVLGPGAACVRISIFSENADAAAFTYDTCAPVSAERTCKLRIGPNVRWAWEAEFLGTFVCFTLATLFLFGCVCGLCCSQHHHELRAALRDRNFRKMFDTSHQMDEVSMTASGMTAASSKSDHDRSSNTVFELDDSSESC